MSVTSRARNLKVPPSVYTSSFVQWGPVVLLSCNQALSFCFVCFHHVLINALQLSLYWESDLRNLSYFLNKRKELEYNIWNPADLQYLATLVRGKVTKTIELQGISQYWKGNEGPFTSWRHFEQQGSWRFCCWELKMLVTLHGLLCSTWKFYQIFV